jgi:hypothetical protein
MMLDLDMLLMLVKSVIRELKKDADEARRESQSGSHG